MGQRSSRQQIVYLPLVLCATFLVTICPVLLVWWLRDSGAVTSVWVGIAIGTAVSFGASFAGAALWKTRTGSEDVLFSELMLWGWVQRWRAERRLATATDVLGLRNGPRQSVSGGRLTHEQKAGLLTQLASALEARDLYTHGHSRRVARHASNIAKRMGLSAAEVAKIRTAGVMHDVGKVKTPTAVLHKEGKLTDGEFNVVQRHPVEGARMVSILDDDELTAMVRHHHERLDGTGYPDGLAGEAIPLGARILAVADTFDAITSTRPYRQAHAHKKAIDILTAEAGTQLDPDAVRAFRSCYEGKRPLVLWTILANGPPRLAGWLGGGLSSAKASSVASVIATAAATTAVGGAAVGPLVEATKQSHRVAEATVAPGVDLPARQRPPSTLGARDGGGRPVDRGDRGEGRERGKGQRRGEMIAPGATQSGRRAQGGAPTTPPLGSTPAPGEGPSGGGSAPPNGSPGPGKGRGKKENTVPKRAPGPNKGRGQRGKTVPKRPPGPNTRKKGKTTPSGRPGNGKRPGPEGPPTPRDAKPPPADDNGPARDPGDKSGGSPAPGGIYLPDLGAKLRPGPGR